MLYAAAPAEGFHIPENPAPGQQAINQQVLPYAAVFRQPQRRAGHHREAQREPDPNIQEQRIEEKAYKEVSDQQDLADAKGFPVVDWKFLTRLGNFLLQKVREKIHLGYLP